MFHSTPWEPYTEYLYPTSPELKKLADWDADFIIYGHTHLPDGQADWPRAGN